LVNLFIISCNSSFAIYIWYFVGWIFWLVYQWNSI
jgi:hypothetical protein